MKTKLKLFLSAGLLAPILSLMPVSVFAQDTGSNQNAVTTQTTVAEEEVPVDPIKLKERLTKRKSDLKTRLTFAKQTRIKNLCKASQGNLSKIHGRINGLETSRTQVYANLLNRLTKLSDKLKEKNVDTTTFDTQVVQLQSLVEVFNADLAIYEEAVNDLSAMDCAADPTGFQASLDAARAARAKTAEDAKAIRTYLTDTIKPTLKDLKSQLEKTADNEGEGTE